MDELARVRQESAHDWSQRLAIAQAEGAEMRARAELALQARFCRELLLLICVLHRLLKRIVALYLVYFLYHFMPASFFHAPLQLSK